jgi:hypothetical protein
MTTGLGVINRVLGAGFFFVSVFVRVPEASARKREGEKWYGLQASKQAGRQRDGGLDNGQWNGLVFWS